MSLYLYALVGRPVRRPLGRGLAREPLRLIEAAGLLVVAGRVAGAPRVTRTMLRRHDATVRRLARRTDAVLPIRFGTVLDDRQALTRTLAPRAAGLREALTLVAGHEQMTLRVYGEAATMSDDRAAEPTDGAGQRYLARRLRARHAPEVDPLRRALRGLVSAERIERHERPPLLASVYHLVRRGDAGRYLATVAAASALLSGVRVSPSGPWPAYAFAPDAA
jgi:Gas vesicle synthesis protein GvpL/GvpF